MDKKKLEKIHRLKEGSQVEKHMELLRATQEKKF